MKKGIVGAVIFLVLAVVASYYIIGMRSESVLKKSVVDGNVALMQMLRAQNSPLDVNFKLANYQNGVFTSSANLDVKMQVMLPINLSKGAPGTMPPMQLPAFTYSIPIIVHHGPFIFKTNSPGLSYAEANLEVPEKYKKMLKQFVTPESTDPRITFSVLTLFDRQLKWTTSIPKFFLESKMMESKLDWLGTDAHFTTDQKFSYIKGESNMSGLVFSQKSQNMTVGPMIAKYDLKAAYPGMWLGTMSANLPKFDMRDETRELVSFSGGEIMSNSYENNGLMSGSAILSFEKIDAMGKSFGPGIFDLQMEKFDLKLLSTLQNKANQLNSPNLSESARQKALEALMPDVLKLAETGPIIELKKLSLVLPEGKVAMNAKASLPEGTKVKTLDELTKVVVVRSTVTAPKKLVFKNAVKMIAKKMRHQQYQRQMAPQNNDAMAGGSDAASSSASTAVPVKLTRKQIHKKARKQAKKQLAELVKSGLILDEGEDYKMNLLFEKGVLTINGQPFDPSAFQAK